MDEHQNSLHDPAAAEVTQPRVRRLGRGLNALLGGADDEPLPVEATPANGGDGHDHIDIDRIDRNPFQPRKAFEELALEELAKSIRQHGILQPLLVRAHDDRFQLIAGERRWLAARRAGLLRVPCRILQLDDQKVCEAAIEENLKRQDLNVLEKAQAFQDYLDRFGCSIEQLAKNLSMSRPAVSNMLRLLELPETVKQYLLGGTISEGHARALLRLDEPKQVVLCARIEAESLTVRDTEAAVRAVLNQQTNGEATVPFQQPAEKPPVPQLTSHVLSLQDQLRDHLGAKVEIRLSGKESGKIIIGFDSNDDFERIIRNLRRAA